MRWEALFADLEAQWDAEQRRELDSEVAERTRAERAGVSMRDRLARSLGSPVELRLASGAVLHGRLADIGADWLLLAAGSPPGHTRPREVLAPLSAVVGVTGLARGAAADGLSRRFGLGTALRELARDRAAVRVTDRTGACLTGTVDAVWADALDLAEHHLDEPRRAANVGAVRTIPFAGLLAVESARR